LPVSLVFEWPPPAQSASSPTSRSSGDFLIFELQPVQVPINALEREQLAVRPGFTKPALVHHENSIRPLNGRQAMGDDDRRASADDRSEGGSHTDLSLSVH